MGSTGFPANTVYAANKAAIRPFARTWTTDLKGRKIRVNVVSPSPTDTDGLLEAVKSNAAAQQRIQSLLGPSGIRVNAVAPGVIDTDMSNFTKTEARREVALGIQALKRLGKPEDVADVVAFIASDGARWITGASIPVDGGSTL